MLRRCSQCSALYEATRPGMVLCRACSGAIRTGGSLALREPAPLIIEGEVLRPGSARAAKPRANVQPGPVALVPSPRAPVRFRGLAAATALALVVGVTVPIAAAIPGIAALFARNDAVVLDRVESTTMVVGGENAIVVTGTLTNPTAKELPVPAVKVALKGGGDSEAYSWLVEPSALMLAPGASVGFRSALKNPVSGAPRIVVSLVPREQRIGMR